MTQSILDNIKDYIGDILRWLDTSTPDGVDPEKYIHLKYTTKAKTREFTKEHEQIDERLLHHIAVMDFLHNNEDYVLRRCQPFYDLPLKKRVVRDHEKKV